MHSDWLQPDWPVALDVGAAMTTRRGGVSVNPYDTMNLGARVGDDGSAVATNRDHLAHALGVRPVFLHQVHGAEVARLTNELAGTLPLATDTVEADAAFTTERGVACVVQVADCMPVLIASRYGKVVGVAHAGWRGLAAGVIERTVAAMSLASGVDASNFHVWLGPCIGPDRFEVGAEVRDALGGDDEHFKAAPRADGSMRWLADLPALARKRLAAIGVASVGGGTWCTVSDPLRFYSYRRDHDTGRHAAAIWIR